MSAGSASMYSASADVVARAAAHGIKNVEDMVESLNLSQVAKPITRYIHIKSVIHSAGNRVSRNVCTRAVRRIRS
eukprot:1671943-Rhodomonas_salina.5